MGLFSRPRPFEFIFFLPWPMLYREIEQKMKAHRHTQSHNHSKSELFKITIFNFWEMSLFEQRYFFQKKEELEQRKKVKWYACVTLSEMKMVHISNYNIYLYYLEFFLCVMSPNAIQTSGMEWWLFSASKKGVRKTIQHPTASTDGKKRKERNYYLYTVQCTCCITL